MFTLAAFLPSLDKPNDSHNAPVLAIRISANYIVSGSADHFLRVWFKSSGNLALPPLYSNPEATVVAVEISEELDLVFGGDAKGNIVIWQLSDGARLLVEPAHNDHVLSLALDQRTLASTSRDQSAKVWELADLGSSQSVRLQLQHTLQGHGMAVLAVRLSSCCIYTASGDKSIRIWDKHSGSLLRTLPEMASMAQFHVTEKRAAGTEQLVGACTDGIIRLYDMDTGEELACLEGHTNVVCSVQVVQSDLADAAHLRIASASYDGTIRLWTLLQEIPFSWECLCTLSFSDVIVMPRSFPSQALPMGSNVAQEIERKKRMLGAKKETKVQRAFDMQVSGSYLYCCGESAQIIVWRL
jgi:WD40 repeat protein